MAHEGAGGSNPHVVQPRRGPDVPPVAGAHLEPCGLSIRQVAERLGVSESSFQRLVAGKSRVSPDMALRLSRVLGRSAESGNQRHEDCFLKVVSIGEIERGIARQRTTDAGFAVQLAGWLNQLLRLYGDRLLPVDVGSHIAGVSSRLRSGMTVPTC